jgi:hypothetical protein
MNFTGSNINRTREQQQGHPEDTTTAKAASQVALTLTIWGPQMWTMSKKFKKLLDPKL